MTPGARRLLQNLTERFTPATWRTPKAAETKIKPPATLDTYLDRIGYLRSVAEKRPVDRKGRPLPWYTYGSISFLEPRIERAFNVFEYGCGNSTLWWSERVASVTCVEHNPKWAAYMAKSAPANVSVIQQKLEYGGDYSRAILAQTGQFDIVVNDGRDRVGCARHITERLAPRGVVVWDNADRERYQEGYDLLTARGFRRIDFVGLGPINWRGWMTSVFYRDDNCLGI